MKRQIKFRVWVEEYQEYQYPLVFSTGMKQNDFQPLILWKDKTRSYTHHIVEQFTGLKDKNGKEIYEGDVVEAIRYDGLVVTGVVGFRDCSFVISTGYQTIYTWMDYQIEIIGNIHENPELLEGD